MVGCRNGIPLLEITEIFGLPLTATFQDLGESSDVVNAPAANCFTPFPNPFSTDSNCNGKRQSSGHLSMEPAELWQVVSPMPSRYRTMSLQGIHVARCGRDDRPDRRTMIR